MRCNKTAGEKARHGDQGRQLQVRKTGNRMTGSAPSGIGSAEADHETQNSRNKTLDGKQRGPREVFTWPALFTVKGFVSTILGGFMVGFGTAYAGGCISGHAISGLADRQLPSLIAVAGFFAGGLIATHLVLPLIF